MEKAWEERRGTSRADGRRAEGRRRVRAAIVPLSLAFTLGVAAGEWMLSGGAAARAGAGASLLAAAAALACLLARGGARRPLRAAQPFLLAGLFLLLGFFCRCNAAALPEAYGAASAAPYALPRRALAHCLARLEALPLQPLSKALFKALLCGQRSDLPPEIVRNFRASGASHLLALSGLHLGILYGLGNKLLAPMGQAPVLRLLRSLLLLGACTFFTLMTGGATSTVRALLFIALHELARLLPGRVHPGGGIFCLALTLQLALTPQAIRSPGFQLSYLAMLGILLVFPRLDALYPPSSRADPLRRVWSTMALTLSCQCFTAPAAWWHFHSFPRYFLLTNLLALPLTELLLVCGLACLACGPPSGEAGPLLQLLHNVSDFLAEKLSGCLQVIATM